MIIFWISFKVLVNKNIIYINLNLKEAVINQEMSNLRVKILKLQKLQDQGTIEITLGLEKILETESKRLKMKTEAEAKDDS